MPVDSQVYGLLALSVVVGALFFVLGINLYQF